MTGQRLTNGELMLSIAGPTGPTGPSQGPAGNTGATGPTGPAGIISVLGANEIAFQTAINALPALGGTILVPPADYSALNPALVSVGVRAVTWFAPGSSFPVNWPGAIELAGIYSLPETSVQANRDARVHHYAKYRKLEAAVGKREYHWHVEGFLPDDGLISGEIEVRGYSFDLGTSINRQVDAVRGIKGRVYGVGGIANLRAIYGFAESTSGHLGELTGLLGTIYRNGNGNATADSYAVRGHVDDGCSGAFQAAGAGKTGLDRCDYGFYCRTGTGQPLLAKLADFAAHGGGGAELITNGTLAANPISASQSTVQNGWQWKTDGGTTTVTWTGSAVTISPDGTNRGYFSTDALPTVNGEEYRITVDVGTNPANIKVGSSLFGTDLLQVTTGIGNAQTFAFTAKSSTSYVAFDRRTAGDTVLGNVLVRGGAQYLGYKSNTDLSVVYKVGNSGYVQSSPRPSVRLTVNGTMEFEATDNSTLTVRYRGTDGVTRSGTIALT